jgi:hypothetical protein
MAHILAPQSSDETIPVFYNVNGVVGAPPASNIREDVLLVQFFINDTGKKGFTTAPELRKVLQAVRLSGAIDAATINAIEAWQKNLRVRHPNPGQVIDKRVSPAKGAYFYGPGMWTIVDMNRHVRAFNLSQWPRIDLIDGCPEELKQMVMRVLVGVGGT